uniref:G-protein coupled receptors family 1 profile domain-containing protein n=1 Tax=Anopheles atroparvus TaxID=41427 RepID=A0A182INE4_ANOAO
MSVTPGQTCPEVACFVWRCGKAVPFVELTVAHASVLTILAISFERYYAICEPLKAGYVCTKARALLICLAAWTVAAILTRLRPRPLRLELMMSRGIKKAIVKYIMP